MYDELYFDDGIIFDDINLKPERSLWFDFYKEVSKKDHRYDIKRRNILPELNFGSVSFDEVKEEMKKRYLFLAENSIFLLAPLIRSEDDCHYLSRSFKNNISVKDLDWKFQLHLVPDIFLSVLVERFLFGDGKLEDDDFYKKVLELKNDPEYLRCVKDGLTLAKDDYLIDGQDNVDYMMFELLDSVKRYIDGQEESINKKRKLCILDEYFKILLYNNDCYEWTSRYALENLSILDVLDMNKKITRFSKKWEKPTIRNKGIGYTDFIKSFGVKVGLFSNVHKTNSLDEKDLQDVYLKLHDELPWNLEIECKLEEPELNSLNDTRLIRPENTKPCGTYFNISEGEIFVTRRGFYHLCRGCGYIVKVPPEFISDEIGRRIKDRCSKDENLFRKMEIISELQALDHKSLPQHKVLFK